MNNNIINFKKISVFRGPEDSPGYLLWRVSSQWRTSIEKCLKEYGLTHPQFVVLATLSWLTKKGAPVSQVEISRAVALDPNTTSQILRGLETKKLIKRAQKIDERSKNPTLTVHGIDILSQALPSVELADKAFFSKLNNQELHVFVKLFQQLM